MAGLVPMCVVQHNDLQAMARAHRMGQKKPVMMYRYAPHAGCLSCTCVIFLPVEEESAGGLGIVSNCQCALNKLRKRYKIFALFNEPRPTPQEWEQMGTLFSAVLHVAGADPCSVLIAFFCRLVTRATVEERMIQTSKKKLLLEHLVVSPVDTGIHACCSKLLHISHKHFPVRLV